MLSSALSILLCQHWPLEATVSSKRETTATDLVTSLIITGLSLKRLLVSLDTHHKRCSRSVSQADSVSRGGETRRGTTNRSKNPTKKTLNVHAVSRFIWCMRPACRKRFELTSTTICPAYHAGCEIAQVQMCKGGTK